MNENIFESTKLVEPDTIGDSWQSLCYMTTLDSFIVQSMFELCRVFRDGTKVKFGIPSSGYTIIGRVKGFPAYCTSSGIVYAAFEINGLPNPNYVLNPSWSIPSGLMPLSSTGGFIDDVNQVYLNQPGPNQIDIYSLEDGHKIDEIIHNVGEIFTTLTWVQMGQVAGFCKNSGRVIIIDYLSSSPLVNYTGRVDPHRIGAYDSTYKLFFTIGTDYKVRVYVGDLIPTGLSDPYFSPALVYGLKSNQVQVRLTGQDGEPLSGWWINWELEGVGGGGVLGSLDKIVSRTDADGYASNLYIGPNDGVTGQCKIKARVVL